MPTRKFIHPETGEVIILKEPYDEPVNGPSEDAIALKNRWREDMSMRQRVSAFGDEATEALGIVTQPLASGLSFGFNDEFGAAVDSLLNGTDYDEALVLTRDYRNKQRKENPSINKILEAIGSIGNPTGAVKTGAGLVNNVIRGTVEGAIYGAGEEDENKAQGAIKGGALGGGFSGFLGLVGNIINRVISPKIANQSAEDIATGIGYKTTPSQKSGDLELAIKEAGMRKTQGSSGKFVHLDANNQKAVNKEVARILGQKGELPNLDSARNQADSQWTNFNKSSNINFTDEHTRVGKKFLKIEEGIGKSGNVRDSIFSDVERLVKGNSISPSSYRDIYTTASQDLEKAIKSSNRSMIKIYKALVDALESAVPDKQLKQFKEALEYENLLGILNKDGVINSATGEVSLAKLYQNASKAKSAKEINVDIDDLSTLQDYVKPKVNQGMPEFGSSSLFEFGAQLPRASHAEDYLSPRGQKAAIGELGDFPSFMNQSIRRGVTPSLLDYFSETDLLTQ